MGLPKFQNKKKRFGDFKGVMLVCMCLSASVLDGYEWYSYRIIRGNLVNSVFTTFQTRG